MSGRTMAFVKWMEGIEYVSGALTKINKKSQHAADQTMLLATHRVAPTENKNCTRLYARGLESITRSTPPTARESAIRTRFAEVSAMVKQRMNNLATIAGDVAAFKAQKDLANGKKTLKAYLWQICGEEYDAGQ